MAEISNDFRKTMADWVELKHQLTEARKDMKVLNTREKELKQVIAGYMKTTEIDTVNLKKGKVSLRKKVSKASMSKKAVENGLMVFFQNDETQVERAMNCIRDTLEEKESDVISLTGLNTKTKE
tara:strand:+ start:14612 stop:14983 length:372 start_codon:yes stop_codon:yes gene_type:complete